MSVTATAEVAAAARRAGGDHEGEGEESGRPEARAHASQRLIQRLTASNYGVLDGSVGDWAAAASRASALRGTAGSVVVHMGGRLALRKLP